MVLRIMVNCGASQRNVTYENNARNEYTFFTRTSSRDKTLEVAHFFLD